jgi:Cu/Ag efflux pump CusA
MDYSISYDVSTFLDASIEQVLHTLGEAFVLVALVVFVFLGDWRSTLIPTLAVPVSLIGAFVFMQAFGITINLITLFALVLAIGIVVDDAIVVVEAVHAKMEERPRRPLRGGQAPCPRRHQRRDHRDHAAHGGRLRARSRSSRARSASSTASSPSRWPRRSSSRASSR